MPSPPDYAAARRIIAAGGTAADAAKAAHVSVRTLRRRMAEAPEDWPRPDALARTMAALEATAHARRRWSDRRGPAADAIGDVVTDLVGVMAEQIRSAPTDPDTGLPVPPDGQNLKNLALTVAILVDKADKLAQVDDGTTDAAARLAAVLDVAVASVVASPPPDGLR